MKATLFPPFRVMANRTLQRRPKSARRLFSRNYPKRFKRIVRMRVRLKRNYHNTLWEMQLSNWEWKLKKPYKGWRPYQTMKSAL